VGADSTGGKSQESLPPFHVCFGFITLSKKQADCLCQFEIFRLMLFSLCTLEMHTALGRFNLSGYLF